MKYKVSLFLFFLIIIISVYSFAESGESMKTMSYPVLQNATLLYSKPKAFEFIKRIPRDYGFFFKRVFRKDQLINIGLIGGSTALLIAYDQNILDEAKKFGRTVHLAGTSNQTALIDGKITLAKKNIPIQFNVPTDVNSAFYYLGDGWTHTSLALVFWVNGLITKDYRSLRTSTEIAECILTTGIATQFIKHITGRESPYTTTVRGGNWHFFPNQSEYADHVPHYDAFPTGHLATAMATVTVIADNYPEKRYIRPIGYSLMGLLGFAMLNNGVHWAGDYPLGIAMGYIFAKVAVEHGRNLIPAVPAENTGYRWKFSPSINLFPNQTGMGIGICWKEVKYFRKKTTIAYENKF
jgi:hypothetical protein